MELPESIQLTISTLQNQLSASQQSFETRIDKLQRENALLVEQAELFSGLVTAKDQRISQLEDQNQKLSRKLQYPLKEGRRDSLASAHAATATPPKSPEAGNRHRQSSELPRRNSIAIAAARNNPRPAFTKLPQPSKYMERETAVEDKGEELRKLDCNTGVKPVDLRPSSRWVLSTWIVTDPEESEEDRGDAMEVDQQEEKRAAKVSAR